MRKSLRNILLSTLFTVSLVNIVTEEKPKFNQDRIYFSIKEVLSRTEKIIGDTLTGNEVGYNVNRDTTYLLIDTNDDKKPDKIFYYIKEINYDELFE